MLKSIVSDTMRLARMNGARVSARHYSTVQDVSSVVGSNGSAGEMPLPPNMQLLHSPDKQNDRQSAYGNDAQKRLDRLRHAQFHPTNMPDSPDFGTNQHIDINEELRKRLKAVVSSFNAPVRYAFAYGSGVFKQGGYDTEKSPMVDFIFGVSHPGHWHALNMQQNPHHYSAIRYFGSGVISMLQDKVGAGVYFNPYVTINGMNIKYGVVSIDRLCKDLIDWDTLYLAGRMHKPVKILRDDVRVRLANQVNLTEAVRVALLSLPTNFSKQELFERIAGISYTGDFRMVVGENPHKVKNIVQSQLDHFDRLYFGLLDDLPNVTLLHDDHVQQNDNPRFRGLMVQKLPHTLYDKVLARYRDHAARNNISLPEDKTLLYQHIAASSTLPQHIDASLRETIGRTAVTQSLKGIITAGTRKTARYSAEKLSKWWNAKR